MKIIITSRQYSYIERVEEYVLSRTMRNNKLVAASMWRVGK